MDFNEHILLVMRFLQCSNSVSEAALKEAINTLNQLQGLPRNQNPVSNLEYAAVFYAYSGKSSTYVGEDVMVDINKHLNNYFTLTKENNVKYEERAKQLNILGA